MRTSKFAQTYVLAIAFGIASLEAQIASDKLEIRGLSLTVETVSVTTAVDVPTTIQTAFGGKTNDEAVAVPGLVAVGELTGPGIATPIQLTTAPGQRFQIPGLSAEGIYYLQNIRLMNGESGLRPATPSVATITVADLVQATLKVRQLTPEEIRSRGIVVDARNYEVYGRLTAEGDEFHIPGDISKGNVIRYVYGADGRLARIVDPVNRSTELAYGPDGLIAQISDWRAVKRNVNYHYTAAKLQRAELPVVANTSNARPRVDYTYVSGASTFNEQLELATNLESITDPKEAISGGPFRVKHTYGTSALERDRVILQQWGTSTLDKVTFAYPSLTNVSITDVLGQQRSYTLTGAPATVSADRAHVAEMRELAVKVAPTPFGQLPAPMPVGAVTPVEKDRVRTFTHELGMMKTAALAEVRQTTSEPVPAAGGIGFVLKSVATNPFGTTGAMSTGAASLLPPTSSIVRNFHYQAGSNFLAAVEEDGKKVNSVEPHRGKKEPAETNDSVETKRVLNDAGQLSKLQSAGGTDSTATGGAEESVEYWGLTDPAHKRGLPKNITRGTLVTTIDYPDENTQVETDLGRQVVTKTEFDAWRRPVKVETKSAKDPLVITQTFAYDATGRIKRQSEAKGSTQYEYDVLGRRTLTRRDGVAVAGGTLETSVTYDLANRKISTKRPGGAVETTTLDKLGRTEKTHIETGSGPGASDIETFFAYDLDGNRVYESDGFISSATAYDAHGRVIGTKASDGTFRTTEYDTWSQPKAVKEYSAAATPEVIGSTTFNRSETGRLEAVATVVDAATTRTTQLAWDGAGRTTSVATNGRASKSAFDTAGRLLHSSAGAGNLAALTEIFDKQEIVSHDGDLPAAIKTEEKSGTPHTTELTHDTAGATVKTNIGSLEWEQRFDAQGDIVSASAPGRPAATYETDSRGAVKKETLPGSHPDNPAENKYDYDATGAQAAYRDPANEPTATINDLLGRPLRRDYADGTSELVEWEGSRIKAVTDRQGRKLVYGYNAKGQLATIKDGAGAALDELTYDDAGRMTVWRTPDAEVSWGPEFDNEGRPKKTTQTRFRDGTGLTTKQVLDQWTQEHHWNEHGERTAWSMPTYSGLTFGAGWTKWVREVFDAMGNLVAIGKVDDPAATTATALMSAEYRNAGRPDVRTVFAGATASNTGTKITRQYGYHDEKSLLNRMTVMVGGVVVAGSAIEHDGVQIGAIQMLGLSGGKRHSTFSYDARSRVSASLFGRLGEASAPTAALPGRAAEEMSVADFRAGQERQPRLDPGVASSLGNVDTSKVDPPSMTASEKAGGGHKIAEVQRGAKVYPFGYNGAEVVDDGRFLYAFDAKGRLVSATEKVSVAPVRRMVYLYSGPGRLVGRRAEYSTVFPAAATDWKLEDRPQVLSADGLPADTTLVWDAITDRLVTVARAAATTADPHGGLLKQVIHGGAGYDDPIETATIDPFATASVNHLYPIYDEAGAGALEAVLNRNGDVVARSVANEPYGADPLDLVGAAVDRLKIREKKTQAGAIAEVELSIGLTEQVSAVSVAAGVRLAALDAAGTLLRTATTAPSLSTDDASLVRWTLTQSEWSALTAGAAKLSIAVTNGLRAEAWGADVPVMPAPEWAVAALPVRTSAELPVELRESVATLKTWLDALGNDAEDTRKLYEVEALALLASSGSGTQAEDILASRMHAHPFTEPMTGLDYVRARWYHPLRGTWSSPDPKGYRDSSNLYAFAAGDPVNRRDPKGEITIIVHGTNASGSSWWRGGAFARAVDRETGDVWKIATAGGKDVAAVPELLKIGGADGKFQWSGRNSQKDRYGAAQRLADYIGVIRQLFPQEPIRVVAHSHGGNVATAATNSHLVKAPASIDRLVTIGKPDFYADPTVFKASRKRRTFYDPDPTRIGAPILSISSPEDDVQKTAAERGGLDDTGIGYGDVKSSRRNMNPELQSHILNVEVSTRVGWYDAHGVLHSTAMGRAIGMYLAAGGASVADWERSRARGGVPGVITDGKDKGE